MGWTRNNKGVFVAVVGMAIVYSLLIRASRSRASNREGTNSQQYSVRMGRIKGTRPMDWKYVSLVVVSFVLLTLTWVLSEAGQSIGIVFLGLGLSVAVFLSSFWYLFNPNVGWCDSREFFSLLAANVILFVLFGFLVPHVPAAGVALLGLFTVVLSYSVWSKIIGESSMDIMQGVLKTILILLALHGIAATLQGLGSFIGLDVLESMGQDLYELLGGS